MANLSDSKTMIMPIIKESNVITIAKIKKRYWNAAYYSDVKEIKIYTILCAYSAVK